MEIITIVTMGRIMCHSLFAKISKPEPVTITEGSTSPVVGNQPKSTEKILISKMARKKDGKEIPTMANTVVA